jgi:glycosyltransferase involved in cell wall biosynthesis
MADSRKANILILAVQVPYTRGGAEVLVEGLRRELQSRGFCTDIVQLPFNALPKTSLIDQMSLWRALRLDVFAGRPVDIVIPTKFPSYLPSHPRKIPWLIHQHRQVYELYNTRFSDFSENEEDETLRQMVYEADNISLRECPRIYSISANVSSRLERYFGISSQPLPPPPPLGTAYHQGSRGDFILSVGRICSIKRVDLMIRALAMVDHHLRLKIVGGADEPGIEAYLKSEVDKHHLWERVDFLGRVDDSTLLELLADCFAVYYAPHDEDYGFVTIEARASGKAVITAKDSGTVLSFITHEKNGLVVEPLEKEIADACNRLYADEALYQKLSFREDPATVCASWDQIVAALTGEDDSVPLSSTS